jgi:hypothetical protein
VLGLLTAEGCSSGGDGVTPAQAGRGDDGLSQHVAGSGGSAVAAGGLGGTATGAGGTATGAGGTATGAGAGGSTGGAGGAGGAGGVTTGGGTGGLSGAAGTPGTGGAGGSAGAAGMSTGGKGAVGGRAGSGGASGGATGGSAGTGGGKSVCGTAAEDASATLTCPSGQIIDSVVFASYGTPTGTCGSFAAGSCDATSAASMIETLCKGRSSCSITASNGTFGDPCHSTVKKLAVEVTCVVGDPIEPQGGPYKGVANSPAAELAGLGATWCYNWGPTPKSTDCADPLFVPMIWGSGDVGNLANIAKAGYKTVLAFNEPNKSDQANLSVADAIALWPQLTANPDILVSSPAVSDDGRAWLEDFMTQAQSKGLRVDFVAMHWYGWNAGSCTPGSLEGAVNWASKWGKPVWITEFGCMGSSNPDEKTVLDFFNGAIPMLTKHPLVERYAWYPWNTYNHLYDSNAMTALGMAFAAAPPTRQ